MTAKNDRRERLIEAAREAQGLGDRERTRELLDELAELDRPEKAVPPKRTESRTKGGK